MSKTTHTPGPWYCTSEKDSVTGEVSTKPIGYGSYGDVALTFGDGAKGNARLIAQAPELLAELRAAGQIIKNALAVMPPELLDKWHQLNRDTGACTEDPTRATERATLIAKAEGGA
ncbi:hypothetical protein [Malikia granosa]|uniref:Uncharacterized protein n=1 Tax=Malikia granosa TaxID=263067 RepID=A0A2S9K991_9BURK|nr:hypothetical protein [Malikia granosa]PRD66962.1 hypothetical protein C6P64_02200 [Malikia granosa]